MLGIGVLVLLDVLVGLGGVLAEVVLLCADIPIDKFLNLKEIIFYQKISPYLCPLWCSCCP